MVSSTRGLGPLGVRDAMQESFTKYYETAYRLRDENIARERRHLLNTTSRVFAEPYLELIPDYPKSLRSTSDILQNLGIPEAVGFLKSGLLPFDSPLFAHQEFALEESLRGRDVVITSGTGSGKTEAFLLPVLTRLIKESRNWGDHQAAIKQPWWLDGQRNYEESRNDQLVHTPGMRSMILYPMNALVEDQLVRLRRALSSPAVESWLAEHRHGHRFYFGRYTGRTPIPGTYLNAKPEHVKNLRDVLRAHHRRHEQLLQRVKENPEKFPSDSRYFLPSLLGSEVIARWDMQQSPPDILVTNYSMLAIALGRSDERSMFEQTRLWIEADRSNVFTLVIDELHMYRGTAGTEVSYLVKRLIERLGLTDRQEQLSIVATSASLNEDEKGERYLREFFARSAKFSFASTIPLSPKSKSNDHQTHANLGLEEVHKSTEERIYELSLDSGRLRARSFSEFAACFKESPEETSEEQLEYYIGSLDRRNIGLDQSSSPAPRFRAHLFFRTLQGIWACSNPSCTELDEKYRSANRKIGRLFGSPSFSCICGGRVLELLYCEACGEHLLGGYVLNHAGKEFLVSNFTNLDGLPDNGVLRKSAANYRVFWPETNRTPIHPKPWNRTGGATDDGGSAAKYTFGFEKASFQPATGRLSNYRRGKNEHSGYKFIAQVSNGVNVSIDSLPPFPTKCPACGHDEERRIKGVDFESRARNRSPIRTQGIGFDRASQVITGALKRSMDTNLVIFSDSRQGAARVTANLELSHYQDSVRYAVAQVLFSDKPNIDAIQKMLLRGSPFAEDELITLRDLKSQNPDLFAAISTSTSTPELLAPEQITLIRDANEASSSVSTLSELQRRTLLFLLSNGTNPAGLALTDGTDWSKVIDWSHRPPIFRTIGLSSEESKVQSEINDAIVIQILRTVFAGGDRDLESIGLAHVAYRSILMDPKPAQMSAEQYMQAIHSMLRLVGRTRSIDILSESQPDWRSVVKRYANKVEERYGLGVGEFLDAFEKSLSVGSQTGYRVLADSIEFNASDNGIWRCELCQTVHKHPSSGICIACLEPLTDESFSTPESKIDYYAWLSTLEGGGLSRLRCEELTGQTDTSDSLSRQARFQGVFLDDEEFELPHGIDVLSVTTTMEAGVDIGALQAVVMANMPPQRFNYQQRVGRAGRRNEHLSVALTICRGASSHDEYYFNRPELMTGEIPPSPFIDTSSLQILRRCLASEALTLAFREWATEEQTFSPGRSVHGEYGDVASWVADPSSVVKLKKYLLMHYKSIQKILLALLKQTQLTIQKLNSPVANDLMKWVVEELPLLVDNAAKVAESDALAEALANSGILPMFGMPTQTKSLFTKRPTRFDEASLERDAIYALSEFAPGAELVKDKSIHTVAGVVDYFKQRSGLWQSGGEPIGALTGLKYVGICDACMTLCTEEVVPSACAVCGMTEGPSYRKTAIVYPKAYRTTYKSRPYEQLSEAVARAKSPKVVMPVSDGIFVKEISNLKSRSSNALLEAINDNNGELFAFGELTLRGSKGRADYSSDGLVLDPAELNRGSRSRHFSNMKTFFPMPSVRVAIAAQRRTDVVSFTVTDLPDGMTLNPVLPEVRGAWASLGYIIKKAAISHLDIGSDEIEMIVNSIARDNQLIGEIFLADTLENGAGYAKWIFDNLDSFISLVDSKRLEYNKHSQNIGENCDSSCYQCIRDYRNSRWHPLLDWRAGFDILDIMMRRPISYEEENDRVLEILENISVELGTVGGRMEVGLFEGVPLIESDNGECVAICNSLEDRFCISDGSRLANLKRQKAKVHFETRFSLLRTPASIMNRLIAR